MHAGMLVVDPMLGIGIKRAESRGELAPALGGIAALGG